MPRMPCPLRAPGSASSVAAPHRTQAQTRISLVWAHGAPRPASTTPGRRLVLRLSTRDLRAAPAQTQGQTEEREETRLHTLFTKEAKAPRNLRVKESISRPTVAPGTELEWRVELSNRSTQPYELLSIESTLTRASNALSSERQA